MDFMQIVVGGVAGLFLAGAGYLQTYKKGAGYESFNKKKFLTTVVLGGIVGIIATSTGLEVEVVTGALMYGGVTAFVERVVKWLLRFKGWMG